MSKAVALVGYCPFCKTRSAELWKEEQDFSDLQNVELEPFQVRCRCCGARGPRCDCGWESAVPAWDGVRAINPSDTHWRGPGSSAEDPHEPKRLEKEGADR
jgi:hypothetical protein